MRVVNVDNLKSRQEKRVKRNKLSVISKRLALVLVSVMLIGGLGYGFRFLNSDSPTEANNMANSEADTPSNIPGLPEASGDIKKLKGNQFRDLYRSVNYPNVTTFSTPPEITGNTKADDRIRQLAVDRGFVLTGYPTTAITQSKDELVAGTEDNLLQPLALSAWRELDKEAKSANVPLLLNSGYRSVERQKELFMERLLSTGISVDQIAAGIGDEAVETTLYMTAPPGFSRHHTGYTIDFICDNELTVFKGSACDVWLQENDFAVAKKHGWIPSYPNDADSQGPEPEPWEYVWVGARHLQE